MNLAVEKLDIAALRTLLAIHDDRSFTRAAERMGVNQSTVSYIVKALRAGFGDPLFVRSGNAIEPTDRCTDIVHHLRPMLDRIADLATRTPFDPAGATGSVTISCNYHERRSIMPTALTRLRRQAPGLTVHLHDATVDGRRQLIENRADIVLGPVDMTGDLFYRRHLFTDRYACAMDQAHPLARETMTLERFCAAPYLAVTHNGSWEARFVPLLRAQGIAFQPAVTVPNHDNIAALLVGTDLIAPVPERLGQSFGPQIVLRPFPLEVLLQINMFWTERTHHSGLHQWVRQVLGEAVQPGLGLSMPQKG